MRAHVVHRTCRQNTHGHKRIINRSLKKPKTVSETWQTQERVVSEKSAESRVSGPHHTEGVGNLESLLEREYLGNEKGIGVGVVETRSTDITSSEKSL